MEFGTNVYSDIHNLKFENKRDLAMGRNFYGNLKHSKNNLFSIFYSKTTKKAHNLDLIIE